MNNEQCIELIHSEIDGTISQEEKKQLHQYLDTNPEMNKLYSQMVNSQNVLNQAVAIDPPAEMKNEILNSIDQTKYASSDNKSPKNFLKYMMISLRPTPKYAYSFSVGIALGAFAIMIFYQGIDNFANNDSQLRGAIITKSVSDDFKIVNSLDIDIPEVSGNVTISRSSESVKIDLLLASEKEIEIAGEFDSNELGFLSFTQNYDRSKNINLKVGSLRFIHQGSNRYNILFENKAVNQHYLVLSIFSGELIYRKKIILESFRNQEN